MSKQSAGIIIYRSKNGSTEVLIGHPGGPFFAKKDEGFWSIPKGLYDESEEAFDAAKREFQEETGFTAPNGEYIDLGEIKRKDNKCIKAWAIEGDFDTSKFSSNTVDIEWPPKSGRKRAFPEIDKLEWQDISVATKKLQVAQVEFIKRLAEKIQIPLDEVANSEAAPEQYKLF